MKDLTPVGTTFPAPRSFEDGDELSEANLEEAFQAAADRDQYLVTHLAELENVILGDGCPKLTVVATSAAMKALEDVETGELRLCLQTPTAFGIYVRVGIGSLPADIPGVAYASTVEAGYWLNVTSPLVTTGGFGGAQPRLNTAVVRAPNSIVADDFVSTSSPGSTDYTFDGSGYQDTNLESSAISVAEGDLVLVRATCNQLFVNDALTAGGILTKSENGGAFAEIALSYASVNVEPAPATGLGVPLHLMTRVTVGAGVTTLAFKLRLKGSSGSTVTMFRPAQMHYQVIRP